MQPVLTNINYISILLNKSGLASSLATHNLMLDTNQRIIALEYTDDGAIYLEIRLKVIPGKQCSCLDDNFYAFIGIQVPTYKKDSIELQEYKKACLQDMPKQNQPVSEEILALRGLFIAFRNLVLTLEFIKKQTINKKDIFNTRNIYLICPSRNWHIYLEKDHK